MAYRLKKKLYIVKREVRANSIKEAERAKGVVYEISLADEKYQPEPFVENRTGFRKKV